MTILVAQHDQDAAVIPAWVVDLQSFRRWATSDEFPRHGWYSHLDGDLWIDTDMERLSHNQVKTKVAVVLTPLIESRGAGIFIGDRMLLTHVRAGISTEPDGMFVSHDALAAGRVELRRGSESIEVLGTPDMVLEVVSTYSKQKDRVVLPKLYHKANVREYWIAEAFSNQVKFELLVWRPEGLVATEPDADGWLHSPVFDKSFRMTVSNDRPEFPVYRLEVR